MMHNLKACPFCGGRPYIESQSRCFINGESVRCAYVRCTECECRTQRVPIKPSQAEAVQKVVNSWNARYNAVSYIPVGDHRR